MKRSVAISVATLLSIFAAAGAGAAEELTFDGLVEVKNARFARAWVDPTIDMSEYTGFIPGEAQFQFRSVRKMSATQARRSTTTEFFIEEKNRQKLAELADEIFNEELGKSKHFARAEAPGPGILIVEGAMLDIVSRVPPESVGRVDVYLDRVGEVTLVLQIRDSVTGEVLARAAERRAAESMSRMGIRASPVTTWAEVRRLFRRWGGQLRDGLDAFHTP